MTQSSDKIRNLVRRWVSVRGTWTTYGVAIGVSNGCAPRTAHTVSEAVYNNNLRLCRGTMLPLRAAVELERG